MRRMLKKKINAAYKNFASDEIFKHASLSILIINNENNTPLLDVNSEVGLAPASCQKVITAATSFDLLGHNYTYKTRLGYTGTIANGVLNGDIIISGTGDPTLGSWRYSQTTEDNFNQNILKQNIRSRYKKNKRTCVCR